MLPRIAYLDFAGRWFGQVSFDLASSGLQQLSADELGPVVAQDDLAAEARFRRRVAERYEVPEAEVVPCLGGSGAVFTVVASCVERGARVLIESPGYEPLLRVPQGLGIGIDRFARRREHDFALELQLIVSELRPDTELVIVTNPHNPSGVIVPDAVLADLSQALKDRAVRLFVDEVYRELAEPRTSARRLGDNVITCSSATKCWGVPWARVGFALMSAELAESAAIVERHIAGRAPPAAWAWGERVLERADALVERARRLQADKRTLVDAFVASANGVLDWVPPPSSSLFGWLEDRRGLCSLALIERGALEHGVVVSPGEFFDAPGWFRLSWSAERSVVEQGLRRLASVLKLST
jgi:aspartate/methionine/tyrosine aminotransferase